MKSKFLTELNDLLKRKIFRWEWDYFFANVKNIVG